MAKLEFYLFDTPKIYEDDKEVMMPVGKLSSILFYLLLKKNAIRNEIAGMFWPNSNDYNSKTSLRNALYKIRNYFKNDIILTPNNSILTINEELDIFIDVEVFKEDPVNNLDLYTGDFLNGFFIKDSEDCEHWILENRMFFKELFITNMEMVIDSKLENGNFEDLENYITKLLTADIFNESAYQSLMKYYESIERYDKLIKTYYKYKKIAQEELGIPPSEEIETLRLIAEKKIDLNKVKSKENLKVDLYNRDFEIIKIQSNIDNFINDKNYKSVFVFGEDGIGKTALINEVYKNNKDEISFFEVQCNKIEQSFNYTPWIKIIGHIRNFVKNNIDSNEIIENRDLNLSIFESIKGFQPFKKTLDNNKKYNSNYILDLFLHGIPKLLGGKIIIVMENLQWADKKSINLLKNLLLHSDNIMFIFSANDEENNLKVELSYLSDSGRLELVELKRFNKNDTYYIAKKNISREISEVELLKIYEKSNGNPFYLKEYIELYDKDQNKDITNTKIYEVLKEKFSTYDDDEKQVMSFISAFDTEVSVSLLMDLFSNSSIDIIKVVNSLCDKRILAVKNINDIVSLNFVFNAYKEYFYKTMNPAIKQMIHKNIAYAIEKQMELGLGNITTFFSLNHHYGKANLPVKVLKYSIYILSYYLYFNHEVFPDLSNYKIGKKENFYVGNDRALRWINSIEKEIIRIKCLNIANSEMEELEELEVEFLIIKGRFFIRTGNYKDGVEVLNKVIKMSKDSNNKRTEVDGHKQMIYCGIHLNNPNIMLKHIVPAIDVAIELGDEQELGVLKRLYGLYNLMLGDFESAEIYFNEAISLFKSAGRINKENINIAAIYNYLGEIRTAQFQYDKALELYEKAINTCYGLEATCISVFYLNAGIACFLMGNINEMKRNFYNAQIIIKNFDSYWKSSMLNAFLGLLTFMDKDYKLTVQYLKMANEASRAIQDPRDIGMIYFVEAIIKLIISKRDDVDYGKLDELLDFSPEVYYHKALNYLDEHRDLALIDYLIKSFSKNNVNLYKF